MTRAADGEDASVKDIAMENRLYPMRELLGDLLLQAGRPREALIAYQTALRSTPNRYRGYYGVALAAQASNDREVAKAYFARLNDLVKHADGERPEVAKARAFLAQP